MTTGSDTSSETAPDSSQGPSMLCSPARGSQRYGSHHGLPVRTRMRTDGSERCATNSWTAPSSGTRRSSGGCSSSTSTTTTATAPIAGSTNAHPTTPPMLSRSAQASRSNATAPAPDSSTSTHTAARNAAGHPRPTRDQLRRASAQLTAPPESLGVAIPRHRRNLGTSRATRPITQRAALGEFTPAA